MDHRPDQTEIPEALSTGLRRLEARHRPAWDEIDPVLAAAARPGRRPLRLARWTTGLAAAAGLAVAAVVWLAQPSPRNPASPGFARSGPASPVTMLDAYRLRLMLDEGQTPPAAWDANHDGAVTAGDVDTLAASAVRLGETSS